MNPHRSEPSLKPLPPELEPLHAVLPLVRKVPPARQHELIGWVRRTLLLLEEEQRESDTILSLQDPSAVLALVRSIPWYSEKEKGMRLQELALTPEEVEVELTHWAFRHQSVRGELLLNDELIAFRLVRSAQKEYLLFAASEARSIETAFQQAFLKPADVFSNKTLVTVGAPWFGWAWVIEEDPETSRTMVDALRRMWQDPA